MKFVGLATNFYEVRRSCEQLCKVTKFVGLTNNFWKVCKTCKNFMNFVDWKFGFTCVKVFLYLTFTHSNILIGKYKFFVSTFYDSGIFLTDKLNIGCI